MRLINVSTLILEEFTGKEIPKYAILSHTWVDGEEVTFQEFLDQKGKAEKGRHKSGWDKIKRTARLARQDNHQHIWIDTCCIDKTSSAELTEAINSMMSWYEQSQVCYTYLADVPSGLGYKEQKDAFCNSRWFTRGWTLQELLAPSKLIFIFADWKRFDTREEMAYLVSSITGIDTEFLHTLAGEESHDFSADGIFASLGRSPRARLDSASIAQRMSWASNRQTTRVEDMAYCLLGIFNINMPLLYGEGAKAFLRLQEQIMMNSDDQSILAWNFEGFKTEKADDNGEDWYLDYPHKPKFAGLLATSPSAFSTCQSIKRIKIGNPTLHSLITNKGLRLELPLGRSTDYPCAFLQCKDKYAPASVVALPLKPTPEGFYVRATLPLKLVNYQLLLESRPTELYALKYGAYTSRPKMDREYTVMIRNLPKDFKILNSCSESGNIGPYSQIIIDNDGRHDKSLGGALLLGDRSGQAQLVLLVVSRRNAAKGAEAMCGLMRPTALDRYYKDIFYPSFWNAQKSPTFSKDTLGLLKRARQTLHTADGDYSTSVIIPESFGRSLIFIDVSIRSTRVNGVVMLLRPILLWFRNYMQGYDGMKKFMLLLVLAPRVFTIVVEFLARKSAAYPWFMVPFMTDYVFLTTSEPPHFLASALARGRKESLQALKRRAAISLLAYLSCKLIGSDTVLERFKKVVASRSTKY